MRTQGYPFTSYLDVSTRVQAARAALLAIKRRYCMDENSYHPSSIRGDTDMHGVVVAVECVLDILEDVEERVRSSEMHAQEVIDHVKQNPT